MYGIFSFSKIARGFAILRGGGFVGLLVLPSKFILSAEWQPHNYTLTMGSGQVVRHQVLVLAFGGSSPSSPATMCTKGDRNPLM